MKNLRKLVIASFMLVIAFVAVVSSTYAWFTSSDVATVNNISVDVVDAKYALLISKDGYETNPTWGKAVELNFAGKMTPTTLIDGETREFKTLDIASGTELAVTYNTAVELDSSDAEKKGYITFDLWFQVDAANDDNLNGKNIVLDVKGLKANKYDDQEPTPQPTTAQNELAISSFRLAAASVSGTPGNDDEEVGTILSKVASGSREGGGTYGVGQQFNLTNNWMSIYKSSTPSLVKFDNDSQPTKYQLVSTDATSAAAVAIKEATTEGNHEISIPLVTALNGADAVTNETRGYAHIRVYVWMEGWDGDCINAAAGCQYVFGLEFRLE